MDRHGLVCRAVLEQPDITQRELAGKLDVSLGTANGLIKECLAKGYIGEESSQKGKARWRLMPDGQKLLDQYKVDGALIIAAGFGSRFVPLTFETPKGLLEVFGERMIERQIKQLHEVGIRNITIAVGYLKEKFEYLIDKYGVELLYNPEYTSKNTLTTIYRARKVLEGRNMYVLSSDNWMRENMYHSYECGAWYSSAFQKGETREWCLYFNKKGRITGVKVGGRDQWVMYGPAYFSREFSRQFLPVLEAYYKTPGTEQFYWEQVYVDMLEGEARRRLEEEGGGLLEAAQEAGGLAASRWDEIEMDVNRQPDDQVYEFENLEELRLFDLRPCLRDGPPASLLQNADAGLSFPHRLQGVPASSHLHRCFAFRRSFLVCPGYALRLPLRHSADGRRNRSWARQPNLSRGHLMQSLLTPCRQIPAFPAWIRLPNLRGPPVRRPLSPARCLRYARGALYLNQPRHRRPNRASCCGFLISLLPHQIHCQTHDSFVHPHSIT